MAETVKVTMLANLSVPRPRGSGAGTTGLPDGLRAKRGQTIEVSADAAEWLKAKNYARLADEETPVSASTEETTAPKKVSSKVKVAAKTAITSETPKDK